MPHIISANDIISEDYGLAREIINTGASLVEVRVIDPRKISADQRRKARAIIGDIYEWSGQPADYLHDFFKYDFCTKHDEDYFSLANCSVTVARHYITYLIDFCLYHEVPLRKPVLEMCDDLEAATYACIAHRKCLVCGSKDCDMHHVDRVGMGLDRDEISHEGMRGQPLCREHHSECHTIGQDDFDAKYHTVAIALDRYLCMKLGLNYDKTG
ncbi:hypothetical protein LJC60_01000 [Ruminococcaceae bacterium OttesenSCG-928-D13]|nr:hypothetical protein [Ruminococcaceae bacterium OttesenSCG-928-D13]